MSFTLQTHQLNISRYLASQNRKQKGLLAIHGVGTGKTISGLAFIQNYPKKKVVILLPKGLEVSWENEMKALNIVNSKDRIHFVYYDDFNTFMQNNNTFSDYILIADEAHKLVQLIRLLNQNEIEVFFNKLESFFKILLLTGTPIYESEDDLKWLINIAAGKIILPINENEFIQKYYTITSSTSIVKGWIQPIFSSTIPLIVLIIFGLLIPMMKYMSWGLSLLTLNLKDSISVKTALTMEDVGTKLSKNELLNSVNSVQETWKTSQFMNEVVNNYSNTSTKLFNVINEDIVRDTIKLIQNKPKDFFIQTSYDFSKSIQQSFGFSSVKEPMMATFFSPFIFMLLLTVFATITLKYSSKYDRLLNVDKFVNDTRNYISYYTTSLDNEYFPTFDINYKTIQYSKAQIDIWIKMTIGQLSAKELYFLQMSQSMYSSTLFGNIKNEDLYKNKGRLIGNHSFIKNKNSIEYNDDQKYNIPKFKQILNIIGNDMSVIYSNFEESSKFITQYFNLNGKKAVYFSSDMKSSELTTILTDFEARKIQIICLDPIFTEGITIKGASQLHILEPIDLKAKKDQVIGRVIRFKSHYHLPKKEQHVSIYEWVCSVSNCREILEKNYEQFKNWYNTQFDVIFTDRTIFYPQDITPDEIMMKKQKLLGDSSNQFINILKQNSVETIINENEYECCVWNEITNCSIKHCDSL